MKFLKEQWAAIIAVLAGLCGLRKRAEFEKDIARLRPITLIVAAITVMSIFVSTIHLIIKLVLAT